MRALLEGVDAVVHLGGVSTEQHFDLILQANIVGAYNLYEAARVHGVKRIVFASSNHVTGFYRQDEVIDPRMPVRPDGHYGLSKAYRREPGAVLLGPPPHRDGEPAHRLVLPRAEGPPHARHLAEPRRPRAPGGRRPHRAGGRPQHRLRHVRQHHDLVGQHAGAPPRLPAAGQLGAVPRRGRGAPARASTATTRPRCTRAAPSCAPARSNDDPNRNPQETADDTPPFAPWPRCWLPPASPAPRPPSSARPTSIPTTTRPCSR